MNEAFFFYFCKPVEKIYFHGFTTSFFFNILNLTKRFAFKGLPFFFFKPNEKICFHRFTQVQPNAKFGTKVQALGLRVRFPNLEISGHFCIPVLSFFLPRKIPEIFKSGIFGMENTGNTNSVRFFPPEKIPKIPVLFCDFS